MITHVPVENHLRIKCLCTVPLAFSLPDTIHFQSYLSQHLFLPPLSERLFPTFLIQLDSCVTFFLPFWCYKIMCVKKDCRGRVIKRTLSLVEPPAGPRQWETPHPFCCPCNVRSAYHSHSGSCFQGNGLERVTC